MRSTRVERPEQLTLEVGRYSASVLSIAVGVVFFLVVVMLLNSNRTNNNRAEEWRQRAVAAEEVAIGLRVVLAERSRMLNQRTRQANVLVDTLASSRGALRKSKVSFGALTARQQQLAGEKARAETERKTLEAQKAKLASVAATLSACTVGLEAVVAQPPARLKAAREAAAPLLTRCSRARSQLAAVPTKPPAAEQAE
jgi:hypothetical protein